MSTTADLRKLITAQLNRTQGTTYYRRAPKDAAFPYKTFDLSRVDTQSDPRDDIDLTVDIWDKALDPETIEAIGDQIEAIFNKANLPQENILPTFYRDSRYPVDDPDQNIQHIQIHFLVENIKKEE